MSAAPPKKSFLQCFPSPNTPTFYGLIDAYAEADSGGSQGSRFAFDSGGLAGTRLGVKGNIDLASVSPGLKAIYQIEAGTFVNNGKSAQGGTLFGRQMYAGLSGDFGTVTFGRQYTPLEDTGANFDAFGQGYGSAFNDGEVSFGLDSRYNNALIYTTPTSAGLSASAMFAAGGQTGGASHNTLGLAVNYASGPFAAGLALQRDNHDLATNAIYRNALLGASYDFGSFKLMGALSDVKNQPDAAVSTTRHEYMVGATINVTREALKK